MAIVHNFKINNIKFGSGYKIKKICQPEVSQRQTTKKLTLQNRRFLQSCLRLRRRR